jgi:hypothetical protein
MAEIMGRVTTPILVEDWLDMGVIKIYLKPTLIRQ